MFVSIRRQSYLPFVYKQTNQSAQRARSRSSQVVLHECFYLDKCAPQVYHMRIHEIVSYTLRWMYANTFALAIRHTLFIKTLCVWRIANLMRRIVGGHNEKRIGKAYKHYARLLIELYTVNEG